MENCFPVLKLAHGPVSPARAGKYPGLWLKLGPEEILMKRLLGITIFGLLLCLIGSGPVSATTYYVAANGSDSNSGTTKTTPWLHAPGMVSCTGTCASANPVPG